MRETELSREKQIEEMAERIYGNGISLSTAFREDCRSIAIDLYYADFRKQRHGTWYHGVENGAVYAKCSACGRKMNYSCYGYAYCSLCGARMDGAKMKGGAE